MHIGGPFRAALAPDGTTHHHKREGGREGEGGRGTEQLREGGRKEGGETGADGLQWLAVGQASKQS